MDPNFARGYGWLYIAAYELGHPPDEVFQAARTFYSGMGFPDLWLAALDSGYESAGVEGALRSAVFAGLAEEFSPSFVGSVAARIGEEDVMLTQFARAIERHEPGAVYAPPFLLPHRDDPRFAALLRNINHPRAP